MRNMYQPTHLSIAIAIILSGVAGCTGGDFGTTTQAVATPVINPTPPRPSTSKTPITQETTDTLTMPALGFLMKGAVRSDDSDIKELSVSTLQTLGDKPNLDHALFDSQSTVKITGLGDLKALNPNGQFIPSQDNYGDYAFVRFGHLIQDQNLAPNGKPIPQIYTFYHGDKPSHALPSTNNISYKGHWTYMSDARAKKAQEDKTINVDIHGADNSQYFHDLIDFSDTTGNAKSASATHASRTDLSPANTTNRYDNMLADFVVNFADKKLTGTLAYENPYDRQYPTKIVIDDTDSDDVKKQKLAKMRQPYTPLYHINAKINQNRFVGEAVSQVGDKRTVNHYNTTYTHTDTRTDKALFSTNGVVEGGFYGDNGAELAGKFITNNHDLMGVFGAKKTTNTTQHTTLFDNVQFDPSQDNVIQNHHLTDILVDVPATLPVQIPADFQELAQDTQKQDEIQENLGDFWEILSTNITNFEDVLTGFDELDEPQKDSIETLYATLSENFENDYTNNTVKEPLALNLPEDLLSAMYDGWLDKIKAQSDTFWEMFSQGDDNFDEKLVAYDELTLSDEEMLALDEAYTKARTHYLNAEQGQVSTLVNPQNSTGFGDPTRLRIDGKAYNLNAKTPDDILAGLTAIKINEKGKTRTLVLAQTPDGKTSNQYIHVCCDDLSWVKFGRFKVGEMTDARYFVQGTRSTSIPTSGQASYQGHWTGFIDSTRPRKDTDAIYTQSTFVKHYFSDDADNNTASFTADFGNKTLTGQLLTGTQPVLDVNAKIDGTAFYGTAQTQDSGFTFNRFSTGAKETIHIKDATVQGGFYGDNGKEIGGVISYNNNDGTARHFDEPSTRLGVVFGAKQP